MIVKTNNKHKQQRKNEAMKLKKLRNSVLTVLIVPACLICAGTNSQAQDKKPNILFIMGDDIGIWNIGAYHRGMMAGRTPNLDKHRANRARFVQT